MDLSNWGPVGTPEQIADWLRDVRRRAVSTTSSAVSARSTSSGRSSASRRKCCLIHRRASEVTSMATDAPVAEGRRGARRRRLHVGRAGRRRHDHLRRRARRAGRGDRRGLRRARRLAGRHEQREAGARGRADTRFPMAPPRNLHQAMVASDEVIIVTNLEWANRFAHVSAVKETCAANGKIASVEEGMGSWDLTGEMIEDATARAAIRDGGARGQEALPGHGCERHRRDRLDRGAALARGDADQAARPDDGPGAALGRGRVRGGRGLHPRARSSSTASCSGSACPARSRSRSPGRSRAAAA